MRLLVLGGTKNLGRHVVEAALAADHELTLFNRGLTRCGLGTGGGQRSGVRGVDPRRQHPASTTALNAGPCPDNRAPGP
jgi:uncharacterized protein YbjT (DUF2867 family)